MYRYKKKAVRFSVAFFLSNAISGLDNDLKKSLNFFQVQAFNQKNFPEVLPWVSYLCCILLLSTY
jgi:hypothetical protein